MIKENKLRQLIKARQEDSDFEDEEFDIEEVSSEAPHITNGTILIDKKGLMVHQSYTTEEIELLLFSEIQGAAAYLHLGLLLRNLTKKDKVTVRFANNSGGSLDGALHIIYALMDTKAKVTGIVESDIYSAATLIALSIDDLKVRPGSMFMFHAPSTELKGKTMELISAALAGMRRDFTVYETYYRRVLTKKEIKSIINGKDLYLGYEELLKRLKRK